ncbi:MAG: hypothetical protein ACREQ9_04540 [Candidatus Binatia bacterium]
MDDRRQLTSGPDAEPEARDRVAMPDQEPRVDVAPTRRPAVVLVAAIGQRRRMGRVVRGGC